MSCIAQVVPFLGEWKLVSPAWHNTTREGLLRKQHRSWNTKQQAKDYTAEESRDIVWFDTCFGVRGNIRFGVRSDVRFCDSTDRRAGVWRVVHIMPDDITRAT